MQILKLFQCFSQSPTTTHSTDDDVINDVLQYDSNCEYGEQGLQISHAYFCFVSAFCFTCKHAETKLKQNNFTETKHCFAFVLFQFYFSFISDVTIALKRVEVSRLYAVRASVRSASQAAASVDQPCCQLVMNVTLL